MNIKYKLFLAVLLSLIVIPRTAYANAIIPYMVVPWGQLFLLPIVVLIEAIVLSKLLHDKLRATLFQSFIANIVSTIVGAVLLLATTPLIGDRLFEWWFKGGFSSEAVRSACIAIAFTIVLWTVSWTSETIVIARMRKASSIRALTFPCAIANSTSYAMLLVIALWSGLPTGSVVSHVDLNRNSENIETFLKPDKNFPYIGFWKHDCADNFGVAIEATADGKYTMAFCGPGGCDKTENLEHTSLTGDPRYKIIDENTIEERNVDSTAVLHRCETKR